MTTPEENRKPSQRASFGPRSFHRQVFVPCKSSCESNHLKGKTAIITGGAGIGTAIARRYIQSGATCLLWDISEAALDAASQRLDAGEKVTTATVDIRDEAAVESATSSALSAFGAIDILVNNAGIAGVSKKLWECSATEWRDVIELNLYAVFLCRRALSSNATNQPGSDSQHRLHRVKKAIQIPITVPQGRGDWFNQVPRQGVGRHHIRVNCITPAVVQTVSWQVSQEHVDYMLSKIPIGRFCKTDEVAAMAAWLASEDISFTTGGVFDISGGRATY